MIHTKLICGKSKVDLINITIIPQLEVAVLAVNFNPTILKANERYIFHSPKYILPSHNHEYIKLTCRYQLPLLLNQYNAIGNDAENIMDHNSSQNLIKNVNTK